MACPNMVQDVLYKMLSEKQRRDLHKAAALQIQAEMATADTHTASTLLPQLAHHWFQYGEVAPALQFLMQASREVRRVSREGK